MKTLSFIGDDDGNLIVFSPKADDNSCVFVYSIHVLRKIGISFQFGLRLLSGIPQRLTYFTGVRNAL